MSDEVREKMDYYLSNMAHYKRHPQLLPFIGSDFPSNDKKVLLVGESHYLDGDKNVYTDKNGREKKEKVSQSIEEVRKAQYEEAIEKWYDDSFNNLELSHNNFNSGERNIIFDHQKWYNTRGVIYTFITEKKKMFSYRTFWNPIKAYFKDSATPSQFEKFAFMNYYQIPIFKGGEGAGEKFKDSDNTHNIHAYENLNEVIKALDGPKVIFISSKAYNGYKNCFMVDFPNCEDPDKVLKERGIEFVVHPTARRHWWWGKNGRSKFERILHDMEFPKELNNKVSLDNAQRDF